MTEFSRVKKEFEDQLVQAKDSEARAKNNLDEAKNHYEQRHQAVTTLQKSLAETALELATTTTGSGAEAWQYLETRADYTEETWEIIKSRLPKLLALQANPNELYLHIREVRDNQKVVGSHAALFRSADVKVSIDNQLTIQNNPLSNGDVMGALQYPEKNQGRPYSFTEFTGGLIGIHEVKEFVDALQDDPTHEWLMEKIALELAANSIGKEIYMGIPSDSRTHFQDYAFNFMRYYPHMQGDMFSDEVKAFPKVVQLISTEAGLDIDKDKPYYITSKGDIIEKISPLYISYLERKADLSATDQQQYENSFGYIMFRAYEHYERMKKLNWVSAEY